MRPIRRRFVVGPVEILLLAWVAAGCSDDPLARGGRRRPAGARYPGTGGSRSGGTGGSRRGGPAVRRSGGSGGAGGGGGAPVAPDAASGARRTRAAAPRQTRARAPRGTADRSRTAGAPPPWAPTGGPQPSYEGEIPIHYGPEVGPIVEMDCPGDPTEGWTEYQDSFNVQRPHDLPINTRFSITGGIYNFWVFPDDAPHSPNAKGRNPRTEARYGGTADAATGRNFRTGMRMYSADMLIERNAVGSAIMQIHTTADGGGPIGVRIAANGNMVNNGSLTVVQGNTVPGGLIDKWFNYKASFDSATQEVKIYINNCLKSTYRGPRGDGNFYFKNGVYFCKTSQNGCFSHYKNIHLYRK